MTDQQWLRLFKGLDEAALEYAPSSEMAETFRKARGLVRGVLQRDFGMTDEQIEKGQTVIGNIDPNTRECLEICDVHCNPTATKDEILLTMNKRAGSLMGSLGARKSAAEMADEGVPFPERMSRVQDQDEADALNEAHDLIKKHYRE